jgi:GAF domain-containing protein
MNTERLLREVDKRLGDLDDGARAEVLQVLEDELLRERRRTRDFPGTVQNERERRVEAETLREVLEAITRQARLEETIGEVLKQLARIVPVESCSLALKDAQDSFRVIAGRGCDDSTEIGGRAFRDQLTDAILETRWPVSITDVREDARFVVLPGAEEIRSWAGIPLLVEGDVIGILSLDRHRVEPFDEEELHRAKAVAFSAAAAVRKAQQLEQIQRYATLMERLVEVDQAVFADKHPDDVARLVLEGAMRIGAHRSGLLVLAGTDGPHVGAAEGAFEGLAGRPAPVALIVRETARVPAAQVTAAWGAFVPIAEDLLLVPLTTGEVDVGTIVLLDPDGETADDRLLGAYASRAAAAYLHAVRLAG